MIENDWKKEGTDIDIFWKILKKYDEKTNITKTSSENLSFYHIIKETQNAYLNCYVFKPFETWHSFKAGSNIIKGFPEKMIYEGNLFKGKKKKIHCQIISEMLNNNNDKLMIQLNGKLCFIMPKVVAKLAALLNLKGSIIARSSIERDLMLTKSAEEAVPLTIVSVAENNAEKIINILGEKYVYTPQIFIREIYNYIKSKIPSLIFNNIEIKWKIDHLTTELNLIFSNKLKDGKCPIIEIKNSVSGYSSFSIRTYYKENEKEINVSNISRKHTVELNKDEMIKEINKALKKIKVYSEKDTDIYSYVENKFLFDMTRRKINVCSEEE